MNQTIKTILENEGIVVEEYIYIDKTCDNIKLIHKETKKEVNIRW